jgi:hypothetical protein
VPKGAGKKSPFFWPYCILEIEDSMGDRRKKIGK